MANKVLERFLTEYLADLKSQGVLGSRFNHLQKSRYTSIASGVFYQLICEIEKELVT